MTGDYPPHVTNFPLSEIQVGKKSYKLILLHTTILKWYIIICAVFMAPKET